MAQIKPDNRPKKQVKLEDDCDDCRTKWKMYSLSPFMWLRRLPPSHAHSVSLWWSVIRCGHCRCAFGYQKNTLFICFQFHLNDSSPWSRSRTLTPAISLSHLFISLVPIFHFDYKNSPYSRSPGRPPVAAVLKIIITHIASFFLSPSLSLSLADSFQDERCRK